MGRTGVRLPGFCLNRIRPHVRVKSPPTQADPDLDSAKTDRKDEICGKAGEDDGEKSGLLVGRKIMVVVDSSIEAKGAIQWALTHTVQCQDTVVLLYVTKLYEKDNDGLEIKLLPMIEPSILKAKLSVTWCTRSSCNSLPGFQQRQL